MKPHGSAQHDERFNDDFHGIDPHTGKPFSYGVPDGLWIISAIYGFILVAAVAISIYALLSASPVGFPWFVPGVVGVIALGPPIVLLLSRNSIAVIWLCVLTILVAVGVTLNLIEMVQQHALGVMPVVTAIGPLVGQGWMTYYAFSLRRQRILA